MFLHFVMVIAYVLWAELWFVVVCRCIVVRQKYSENYFHVGIIAVEILRWPDNYLLIFFLYS